MYSADAALKEMAAGLSSRAWKAKSTPRNPSSCATGVGQMRTHTGLEPEFRGSVQQMGLGTALEMRFLPFLRILFRPSKY